MTAPSPNGGNGRQNNGRFAPGNPGGPGNPFGLRVARLRSTMLDAVTEDDLRQIVKAMLDKAKAGELAAAKLVFDYCIGRPAEAVNPDALEAEALEMEQRCEEATPHSPLLHAFSAARRVEILKRAGLKPEA